MDDLINYIEDKDVFINKDWYYHGSSFSYDNYINILTNGLLAPYCIKDNNSLYKYIFLAKASDDKYSAFYNHSIYPNFIINNNIPAININDSFIKKFIYNGFYGLKFTSLYKDEYQVYKIINKEDIIGIIYNIDKLINNYENKSNYYFNILYDLVILLDELKIDIPIIDYYTRKEINKKKVLTLGKKN